MKLVRVSGIAIKNSWVVTSIILPVSFGLIGVSFTEQLLALPYFALLPLMLTSISLYTFWYFYTVRYAGYLKTTYITLQKIEERLNIGQDVSLHRNIADEDKHSCFKKIGGLGTLNRATGLLLIVIWVLRLAYTGFA